MGLNSSSAESVVYRNHFKQGSIPHICNIYIHIDVLQVLNSVLNINFYAQIQMAMAQNWVPQKKLDG